jgi:hypothetical protein
MKDVMKIGKKDDNINVSLLKDKVVEFKTNDKKEKEKCEHSKSNQNRNNKRRKSGY